MTRTDLYALALLAAVAVSEARARWKERKDSGSLAGSLGREHGSLAGAFEDVGK